MSGIEGTLLKEVMHRSVWIFMFCACGFFVPYMFFVEKEEKQLAWLAGVRMGNNRDETQDEYCLSCLMGVNGEMRE